MRSANPDTMAPVTVESDHLSVARDLLHTADVADPDFFDLEVFVQAFRAHCKILLCSRATRNLALDLTAIALQKDERRSRSYLRGASLRSSYSYGLDGLGLLEQRRIVTSLGRFWFGFFLGSLRHNEMKS